MRKFIIVVIAIAILFSTVAFADDLSVLTDEELLALHRDVLDEMERRSLPDTPETDSELADVTERVISFFVAWSRNNLDEMLALCDSGWKATVENPRTALVGILTNMIPTDATIEAVNEIGGESPDGLPYYLVSVNSHLDGNDGKSAKMYKIQFLVRKEEDELWYINPTGIDSREAVEEEPSAEAGPGNDTESAAADMILYYHPDGGEYYHLDQNCLSVNTKYLPLQGSFHSTELNDEPYRTLKRCEVCGNIDDPVAADAHSDSSEGSRLIGLLITREDLTEYTDETGVLSASCTSKGPGAEIEYQFDNVNGLRLICFITPEDGEEGSSIISNVDDGISAVDFEMSDDSNSIKMDATINFVPGKDETLFFYNPVLRNDSGQVFAVPGDFMAVSSAMNPPGSSAGQTIRDERKHTENSSEIIDTTTVNIRIKAVREPLIIRLLQFSEAHELLISEEFVPGTVPEQIVPLTESDYLLLETVEKSPEGGSFTRREAIGRDTDFLNTMSCRDDGICLCHYHEVLWNTAVPEK